MKRILLGLLALMLGARALAAVPACPVTVGTLTLSCTMPRSAGVSPFLAFFDCTASSDTAALGGANNAYQDVYYAFHFGDTGTSGADTWAYGSRPGVNSRNTAQGAPVSAHLYVLPINATADVTYSVQVNAFDGTNTAACTIPVTVQAPSGASGYSGTNTTCVAAGSTPAAGSGGCPAGAAVSQQSNFGTALGALPLGKRFLFKCGDTFTGSNVIVTSHGWSIGAYGSPDCSNTTANRPIFSNTTTNPHISFNGISGTVGDARIADIDFEGNGSPSGAVTSAPSSGHPIYQVTMWNLRSNGNKSGYTYSQGAQMGVIASVQTQGSSGISTYLNFNQYNPPYSGNTVNNLDYQALIGSSIQGIGPGGGGCTETVRFGGGTRFVISDNTITDGNDCAAVLKLHQGNTNNSNTAWVGSYTEFGEISDNFFGGNSGAQLVEVSPEDAIKDERIRFVVIERNLFGASTGAQGGKQLMLSAANATARNNVFNMTGVALKYPYYAIQLTQRGATNEPVPTANEVYNNICWATASLSSSQVCVAFANTNTGGTPTRDSFAYNNLFYIGATGRAAVLNSGTNNAVGANSTSSGADPAIVNRSGALNMLTDFKPTANFTGAVSVPNWFDATGLSWLSAYRLGPFSAAAPTQ